MVTPDALNRIAGLARAWLNWIAAQASAEIDRWPLWLSVGLGAGVGIYFSAATEPHWLVGPLALATALAILAIALRRWPGALPFVALLLALATGFLAAQVRTWTVAAPRI